MDVTILSRKTAEALLESDSFPTNTTVISFYSPEKVKAGDYTPVDYGKCASKVYYACVPDIDIEALPSFGYTYDSYFSDVNDLAKFILQAVSQGMDIICQCDYGQSRSAACAAAILEPLWRKITGLSCQPNYL